MCPFSKNIKAIFAIKSSNSDALPVNSEGLPTLADVSTKDRESCWMLVFEKDSEEPIVDVANPRFLDATPE